VIGESTQIYQIDWGCWGTVEPGPSVGVGGRLTAAQPKGFERIVEIDAEANRSLDEGKTVEVWEGRRKATSQPTLPSTQPSLALSVVGYYNISPPAELSWQLAVANCYWTHQYSCVQGEARPPPHKQAQRYCHRPPRSAVVLERHFAK
jgi:hypothetical protein